jgi:tripartite-type tricarboxylate transporter receptor subunit TctC
MRVIRERRFIMHRKCIVIGVVFFLISALGMVSFAHGVDFKGKTIKWIIPLQVGGGTDIWARIYAPFLHKYLPGNPRIVIKNVPGAGSIVGGNYFHTKVRADGLGVLGNSGSTTFPYLLGVSAVKYDFSKYHIVFGSPTGGVVYIKPDLGVKSARDLKGFKEKLNYASQGATSLDIIPMLAFDMLGLDVKAIFGYKGRGAGRVAFEQGEVRIDYQTSTAYIRNVHPLVKKGAAVPLMTWGVLDDRGNVVRDPMEPDLPCFPEAYEMVHGKRPSGPAWEAWKTFFIAGFGVQKAMWLPEKTPQKIVEAYRTSAAKLIADPEFKEVIQKSLGGYAQMVGKEARAAFDQVVATAEGSKAWMLRWLKDRFDVTVK